MSNITRTSLDALSQANFPNNTTQQISPADLRGWIESAVDSFVTQKDKSTFENAFYENRSTALPSGATVNLSSADGNFVHITGTTTISSFGSASPGSRFILCFDGILTLTYNATSLILPGSANITTAAGDCAMVISEGSSNWRVVGYFPISGGGGGGGTVTSVTATAPLSSTGGSAPDISIPQANGTTNGFLDSADWTTFNGKQDVLSAGTGISIASNTVTNTAPDQVVALTAGTGINTSGTYPNFTIANTAPDQTVALTAGTGIGITGSYPNFTIANTAPSSGGTVTAVTASSPLSSSGGTAPNISLGTVPIANGGTNGTATPTNGGVAYGTGTAYAFTTAGSAGQILQSNGAAAPSWINAPAAMTIGSSIVSGATAGRLLLTTTSGANQVLNQDSNLNYDTTNDRLGIGVASPTGTLHLAPGVAANPQLLLAPSAVTPSGTSNGSIWCNTVSSNTRLTMYKDTGYTNVVTIDRNPDLATTGSGIVLADSVGTLSKGADLTALGIFAQTSTVTVVNTATSTTLIGSVTGVTTLPANFFGVGKTIKVFVSGAFGCAGSGQTCDLKLTIGGVAVGTISLTHGNALTARYYDAEFTLTCRTAGASGTIQFMGIGKINTTTTNIESFFQISTTSASVNTTGTLAIDLQADWVTADPANTISASILHATYLN